VYCSGVRNDAENAAGGSGVRYEAFLKTLLERSPSGIRLSRGGMATLCRTACDCIAAGKGAALLVRGREEFNLACGYMTLFSAEMSARAPDPTNPPENSWVGLPPGLGRRNVWAERISALYSLHAGKSLGLVASPDNLLLRFMPRDFFESHELELRTGDEVSPDLLAGQAVDWGYRLAPMVSAPGECSRRGDILDIFPPTCRRPARVEFFGDMVEDIRVFDPATQRSLGSVRELRFLPALPAGVSGHEKALERWRRLERKGLLDPESRAFLARALEEGGARASSPDSAAGPLLPGIYYDASSVLEEWLPKNTVWLLPGRADFEEALELRREELFREMEDACAPVSGIARFALRESADAFAAFERLPCLYAGEPASGLKGECVDLPERTLHSFGDLFPLPEDRDRPWQRLIGALKEWQRSRRQVVLCFGSERGRAKFLKLAEQDGLFPFLRYAPGQRGLFALIAPVRGGAELRWDDSIIMGEDVIRPGSERTARAPSGAFRGLDRHDDLNAGDLLVHRDYGIGRFGGLMRVEAGDCANDFLLMEYSGQDKLYVPADRLSLIRRYKGGSESSPPLDRLGGVGWLSGREKARKAVEKIAADLVEVYAYRKVAKGFRYGPPGELYREFEASFGFEETPDQAGAIQSVLEDMEKSEPMDRLICGDVGFGKTEVALRAAFRAASEGRQAALLCPTTVLAEQHYRTFRARLANFPLNVGLLSRFVPPNKQKELLKAADRGQLDILIGTHRLLSGDVRLPNLGLLILDEEQRFGVRHKDKLKLLKKNVDVLALTATPIPRTLQLSMSGIRDLSVIETAPPERKAVACALIRRNDALLGEALERELAREGQVFWVHNRVQGLERAAQYVRELVPGGRVAVAHGQMRERGLEETMREFWRGEVDVLVCTSIVESGLDFPRANTLIVDQAQLFGLGQLYQLRGRVGRSERQAYAFFIIPSEERLSKISRERLRVVLELDYLGAGFQVAMEDLRLRGAGNILGEAQSGHMARVGLELFLEMLEEAVARCKGEKTAAPAETEMQIHIPAHIPESYVPDSKERLRCYKSLVSAVDGRGREEIALELRDRFGPLPQEVENFTAVLDMKAFFTGLHAREAALYPDRARLSWGEGQRAVSAERLVALAAGNPGARLMPPAVLEYPLDEKLSVPERLAVLRNALEKARADPVPGENDPC
jgi:transcription-repair coupling factor (superfamily II helicase)